MNPNVIYRGTIECQVGLFAEMLSVLSEMYWVIVPCMEEGIKTRIINCYQVKM